MSEQLLIKPNPASFFEVPGFEIRSEDNSAVTGREGSIVISGENPEGEFSIAYTRGYRPASSVRGEYKEFEPDVIYVDDIEVSEDMRGQGIGYQLRKGLVDLARSEGVEAIRSYSLSPAVITILEKMYANEVITEAPGYQVKEISDWAEQPTTAELLNRQSSVSAEQAISALQSGTYAVVTAIKV